MWRTDYEEEKDFYTENDYTPQIWSHFINESMEIKNILKVIWYGQSRQQRVTQRRFIEWAKKFTCRHRQTDKRQQQSSILWREVNMNAVEIYIHRLISKSKRRPPQPYCGTNLISDHNVFIT